MPGGGVEPPRLSPAGFKPATSAIPPARQILVGCIGVEPTACKQARGYSQLRSPVPVTPQKIASSRSVLTTATAAFAEAAGPFQVVGSRSRSYGAFPPTQGGPHGLLNLVPEAGFEPAKPTRGGSFTDCWHYPLAHSDKKNGGLLAALVLPDFGGLYSPPPSGNTRTLSSNELL